MSGFLRLEDRGVPVSGLGLKAEGGSGWEVKFGAEP